MSLTVLKMSTVLSLGLLYYKTLCFFGFFLLSLQPGLGNHLQTDIVHPKSYLQCHS